MSSAGGIPTAGAYRYRYDRSVSKSSFDVSWQMSRCTRR